MNQGGFLDMFIEFQTSSNMVSALQASNHEQQHQVDSMAYASSSNQTKQQQCNIAFGNVQQQGLCIILQYDQQHSSKYKHSSHGFAKHGSWFNSRACSLCSYQHQNKLLTPTDKHQPTYMIQFSGKNHRIYHGRVQQHGFSIHLHVRQHNTIAWPWQSIT